MAETSFAQVLDVLPTVMQEWLTGIAPLSELTDTAQYEVSVDLRANQVGQKWGNLTVRHEKSFHEQAFVKGEIWTMADSKQTAAQGSTKDQDVADKQAAQSVQQAAAAGEIELLPSETIPGGKYYMQRGKQRWAVNANGERINEDGKRVDENGKLLKEE